MHGYLALCGAPPLHLTSPAASSDLGLKTWKAAAPSSILPSSFFPAHFANYRYGFVGGRSPSVPPSLPNFGGLSQGWMDWDRDQLGVHSVFRMHKLQIIQAQNYYNFMTKSYVTNAKL